MDFKRKFEFGLAWRTLLLVGAIWAASMLLSTQSGNASVIVALLLAVLALLSLWNFVRRTNLLIAQFVECVKFEDYSQRFSHLTGGGFDVLGTALDRVLRTLERRRREEGDEARYLSAIVDDSPSALLAVDEDGRIEMLNKAARDLLGRLHICRLADLGRLGPEFVAAAGLPPGTRKITRLVVDGVPQKAIFISVQVARLNKPVTIMSILPAQHELGAVEVAAQADLVRVLTHEIMNSLTPVTSLARSGADLIADVAREDKRLADAKVASETVAKRAEGILRFVESYREFARAPDVRRREFEAKPWAEEIMRLALEHAGARKTEIQMNLQVTPSTLSINADPELLAQVILNLLRNAIKATTHLELAVIDVTFHREAPGRCRVEVRDNGPGIPEGVREDIFLPFFTTHDDGSGVGLSFARQVALAHGGAIDLVDASGSGAIFRLVV